MESPSLGSGQAKPCYLQRLKTGRGKYVTSKRVLTFERVIVLVMGVAGSGKSIVAALLSAALGCQFQEGDVLHPQENLEKMSRGEPLTDSDRLPWLERIAGKIDEWRKLGECGVLTCSALKRSYRTIIRGKHPEVTLVYLKGSPDLVRRRMLARQGHFMPVALLGSQFAALEEPAPDEHPITVDIGGSPAEIAAEILRELRERAKRPRSE